MVSTYSNHRLCGDECLKPEGCIMPGDNARKGPGRRQVYPKCRLHRKNVFTWANGSSTVTVKPKYNSEGRQSKNKTESIEDATPASRKRNFEDLSSDSESDLPIPQTRKSSPEIEPRGNQQSEPECAKLRGEDALEESQYVQNASESEFSQGSDDDFGGSQFQAEDIMFDDETGDLPNPDDEVPENLPVRRSVKEQFEYESSQAILDNIRMPAVEAALAGWDASRENMNLYEDGNVELWEESDRLSFHMRTPEPYSSSFERWVSSNEEDKREKDLMTLPSYSIDPVIAEIHIESNRRVMGSHTSYLESGQYGPYIQMPATIVEMDRIIGMI